MRLVQIVLFQTWFWSSMVVMGLIGVVMTLIGRRHGAQAAVRMWTNNIRIAMRIICGARTELRGLEHLPEGACLVAPKHMAAYDTFIPFCMLKDPAFVLKRELLSVPVIGWYCGWSGSIPIERDGHAKTLKIMLGRAKEEAARGRPVVIYPEGTRKDVGAAPDYKPGVAAIYRALERPCVPLAHTAGLFWPSLSKTPRKGRIIFEFLPPIEPGLSRDVFMQRLQDELEAGTARLIAEAQASA